MTFATFCRVCGTLTSNRHQVCEECSRQKGDSPCPYEACPHISRNGGLRIKHLSEAHPVGPLIPDSCRVCGAEVSKWRPNRKLCSACARESLRESKRVWQARYRTRQRQVYSHSEESQRRDAAFDEKYERVVTGEE